MEQISNEPNNVRIKFRANPKPTDCQWTIAENDETQKNQSCNKILPGEGIKGEYFVNLSATSEDSIILFVTNELGTSKFHRYNDGPLLLLLTILKFFYHPLGLNLMTFQSNKYQMSQTLFV